MDKSSHLYHYLFLASGLLTSFFFFLYFNQNPVYQMLSALAGCAFYCTWGIIHGLLEQRLNRHIAFEYISLSLFVFAVLFVSIVLI